MTSASSQRPQRNELYWFLIRRMMLESLGRFARRVLLTREISSTGGLVGRWLSADVRQFISKVSVKADNLRPIADIETQPKAGSRLMVEMTIFTSAAYRVLLDDGVSPDTAQELVADIGWDYYARLLRLTSLPFRLTSRDSGVRLQRTIRLLLRFPFSDTGAPGYAVDVSIKGPDILTHFTHCPPQTFVRTLIASNGDRGDLEAFRQSWCKYDWPGADLIASDGQRGHYVRRRTLSLGDSVCDMCWSARSIDETQDTSGEQ